MPASHELVDVFQPERQITRGPGGRILTNTRVWSPDGQWIVYDTRSDAAGDVFDGTRIEAVHVASGEVRVVYEATHNARCGVATFHPREPRVVFILGPEFPTPDWSYGPSHRQGMMADLLGLQPPRRLDARDLSPPFTPGALRGGSHVHVWDPAGEWVSYTYNDALTETDIRDVAVSVPAAGGVVMVSTGHPRNHDGTHSSAVVTRTVARPRPGSDEIRRACEEGWIGTRGYLRPDGSRQRRALAFQGTVLTAAGAPIVEIYIVDLPENLSEAGEGPLAGTPEQRPFPPRGTLQRRLTRTEQRLFPGVQGPRHWLRSHPDGSAIAFLMKDDAGVAQLWTVSPNGGPPRQITGLPEAVASSFDWSPNGQWLAHVRAGEVCVTEAASGRTLRLTRPRPGVEAASGARPEACVFSPDGGQIAFVRRVRETGGDYNQVCVVAAPRD